MYKLVYLPLARQDMLQIVAYIAGELGSPQTALKLANLFIAAGERIAEFPYAHAVYIPIKQLKSEYRRVVVKNYNIFYRVEEKNKKVVIVRVIYGKRDYDAMRLKP